MNSISATSDRRGHADPTPPVLLVFAPGLGPVAREGAGRFPALERLAARGRRRPLPAGPWAALAAHAGGNIGDWPVAPVSFLAERGRPRGGCLRLGPLGTDPDGQGLVRIPAHSLEVTDEEARALGARFDEVLGEGALSLHAVHPRRWYLDGTPGWRGAAGPVPVGELSGEPGLLRLVSETEMLFFDHEVNRRRAAVAAPLVAGIHAWGGGLLPDSGPAGVPAGWGGEPYLAGLWRLAGRELETGPEPLLEAGGVAWPVPAEGPGPGLPAQLEDEVAPGALRALSRGRVREVRLITDDAVIVTTRLGAVLPWRRPRPLAELV